MIPRYTPPDIAAIFADESRLRRWLEVELAASQAWADLGQIPATVPAALRTARIDPGRIAALEAEQGHDVAAFVSGVQETLGTEGRYLHYGLTSSDVVDTALATQLRDAAAIMDGAAAHLDDALRDQAVRHRLTLMPGRTHGVHAEPITLGIKLAAHLDEVRRSRGRLATAALEVSVGQISGAVGTHASVPPTVEERVCAALGLAVAPVATQVVARDRHAAFVCAMAVFGAVLERLGTTVRLLQITEVGEVEEPFTTRQKGSSAMPHKRNPILSERLCGMARLLRGHAVTALDDVALWHERDISHSAAERVILPDACAVLAYMLRLAERVVRGLTARPDRMQANLELFGGLVYSQRILSALVESGWARDDAYRAVQALATRARQGGTGFRELVYASPTITAVLDRAHLDRCFAADAYLEHIDETYRRLGIDGSAIDRGAEAVADGSAPLLAVDTGLGSPPSE